MYYCLCDKCKSVKFNTPKPEVAKVANNKAICNGCSLSLPQKSLLRHIGQSKDCKNHLKILAKYYLQIQWVSREKNLKRFLYCNHYNFLEF